MKKPSKITQKNQIAGLSTLSPYLGRNTLRPLLFCLLLLFVPLSLAQEAVPTLIPPTPLAVNNSADADRLLTESGVARIQRDGLVRVGVLYNEPPFGEFTLRGELAGFDADVARLLAETWEVKIEFVQVTRLNALEMLRSGQVDMLLAAQVHRRELDGQVEFSLSYRVGKQAMMVRADSGLENLLNLANRRVGYVLGTEGEIAVQEYMAKTGVPLQPQAYLTLDKAYRALLTNEVEGIVAREEHLQRVAENELEAIRILADPVVRESFGVVLPRQDLQLRNLVNRTLQYLTQEEKLQTLHEKYFPGSDFPIDILSPWANTGEDAPKPANFGTDVSFPAQYVVPRMAGDKVLRVAGISATPPQDVPEWQRRLDTFQRGVLERIAARWGVTVQYVEGDPLQLVESGYADVGVGVLQDWNAAARVDFSQPYLLYGDRLMVKKNSKITAFGSPELRGGWVAVMDTDTGAQDRAQKWVESVSGRVQYYVANEGDLANALLVATNADVAYGTSLKLIPFLEQNAEQLVLTERWYSRNYLALALPRNDFDFRMLVDYTLQDLLQSGDLATLAQPVTPPNSDAPAFDFWSGSRAVGGFLGN